MRGPQYAGLGWAGLGWGSGVCLVLVVGARRAPLAAHLVLHAWAGCTPPAPPAATPLTLWILPSCAATPSPPHRLADSASRHADSASHCYSAHSFCVSIPRAASQSLP